MKCLRTRLQITHINKKYPKKPGNTIVPNYIFKVKNC